MAVMLGPDFHTGSHLLLVGQQRNDHLKNSCFFVCFLKSQMIGSMPNTRLGNKQYILEINTSWKILNADLSSPVIFHKSYSTKLLVGSTAQMHI